jgi:hypothetical protein
MDTVATIEFCDLAALLKAAKEPDVTFVSFKVASVFLLSAKNGVPGGSSIVVSVLIAKTGTSGPYDPRSSFIGYCYLESGENRLRTIRLAIWGLGLDIDSGNDYWTAPVAGVHLNELRRTTTSRPLNMVNDWKPLTGLP